MTLCLINYSLFAKDIEGFFGGQYTQFKNVGTVYDQYGASARLKYNFTSTDGGGMSAMAFLNGGSLMLGDYMFGYTYKTQGSFFLEGAAYGAYSAIWGMGFAFLGAVGFELGSSVYLSIPLVIRYPSYISIAPMFGMRF